MSSTQSRLLLAVIILILLPALFSCTIEKKFAREFIRNDTTRTALVIPPDYLYKTSLKDYEIENADELDEWVLDSLLYEKSIFLKYIVDSLFLANYYHNYCEELAQLGFRVYDQDSMLTFLSGNSHAYIFHLAQLELEEYLIPVVEKEEFDEYLYYQLINLNAMTLNSWLEISSMNDEEKKNFFFSSLSLTDELDGYFRYNYFSGAVKYDYSIDSLLLNEVYQLGELAAYLYAGYTFDFLMNLYVDQRMLEEDKRRSGNYYHYNRQMNMLAPARDDEQFIQMEEE
ncbi:MAG: hypothetical protein ABFS05_09225 [Bacteroidota bacterium]